MEQKLLEIVGDSIPLICLLIGYTLFKYILPSLKSIKDIFFSKPAPSDKHKGANNININLDQTQNSGIQTQQPQSEVENQTTRILLLQQAKILMAVNTLSSDILREQMECFKKMVRPIKVGYTEIICELLNEAGIENIHFGTYFTNSENFIEICGYHIEATFRGMCKLNHFAEKSNSAFRDIIDTNIFIIDGLLNELLMKRYPQRQLLKDMRKFDTLRADLREALKECFEYSRDIAIDRSDKVKKAVKEYEEQVFLLTGQRYSLDL